MYKLGILFFCTIALLWHCESFAENSTRVLRIDESQQYEWNGKHYPHANPDAPKGGTLRLSSRGSFDSLHAFIPRGMPAAGLGILYESLGESVPDHRFFETHGGVAEKFTVAQDNSFIIFHLNPKAHFHDGEPIQADDVVFTFNTLMEKGAPHYKQYYATVDTVEKLGPLDVRFTFKEKNNKELPLILAQLPVLPEHYWKDKDFTKPMLTPPLGSGPYKIKSFSPGDYIEFERVHDYWGKDEPHNKGRFNFDILRYEYYRDTTVAREAFKAGAFDLFAESTAKAWATAYTGEASEQGFIVREEIPTNKSQGMYGFFFNIRKPLFADIKVRQALSILFDFEWTNKAIFYNSYERNPSYFTGSEMAAMGLPSKEELELLMPYKDSLPEEVFTKAFALPKTKADGNIREQITQALTILKEAGWQLKDGIMQNAKGEPLEFSLLLSSSTLQRVVMPFRNNLKRLGIELHIAMVDPTQYVNRVRTFDYDIILSRIPQSNHPGNEQRNYWSSKAAHSPGSRNYIGVDSPVVDALVEKIVAAQTRQELIVACRALDRVLLWNYYTIHGWFSPVTRVAYWKKFVHSPVAPASGFDVYSWWVDTKLEEMLMNSNTGYGKQ